MHFWKMVSHTTVLFASLNLTIWWPSPVSCHESLNPARHPRLSFQTHSMHRFDMLTGHDVMHSASAYALQYISMEESELSERFFMFFLCCTILILFFVFFGPRAGCVSPLCLLWLVCLLTLVPFVVVFLLCWFWRVLCCLFHHDSIYTIPMLSPVAFNDMVGEDGRIKRKQAQAATRTKVGRRKRRTNTNTKSGNNNNNNNNNSNNSNSNSSSNPTRLLSWWTSASEQEEVKDKTVVFVRLAGGGAGALRPPH